VKKRKHWWRFSLRALLVSIAIASVPVAWLGAEIRTSVIQSRLVSQLESGPISISYHEAPQRVAPLRFFDRWLGRDWSYDIQRMEVSCDADDSGSYLAIIDLIGEARRLRNAEGITIVLINCNDRQIQYLASQNILDDFGSVIVAYLRELTKEEFASLELLKPTRVSDISLAGRHCNDQLGELLERFANLQSLTLIDTSITDFTLHAIAEHPSLKVVHLSDNDDITAEGLALLSESPSLRNLSLAGSDLNAECVKAFRNRGHVEKLVLARCRFDEESLAEFSGWQNLRELWIVSCTGIDSTNLHLLGDIPRLNMLVLSRTGVDKADVASSLGSRNEVDIRVYEEKANSQPSEEAIIWTWLDRLLDVSLKVRLLTP
jgi:hypothetical protein